MIANARMYSVSPEAARLWRALLCAIIERAGLDIEWMDHAEPSPIDELWRRSDKGAVFMCGLPYSRFDPRPELIAAPVPSPSGFRGLPQYWSEWVVRKDSTYQAIEDTFGGRIALTVPDSQSGCLAALYDLMTRAESFPPYREVVTPKVTPLGALTAVIDGEAEVAPIDSYAYCLLKKFRPELVSQLRMIGRTARTPIPVLVASSSGNEKLQTAFLEAHQISSIQVIMAELLLERFVRPDPCDYDALRLNAETATQYWRDHALAAKVHPAFLFR
jgi:ABC-type phosphate/phosphonate transport system substrate-binding protein